MEWLVTPAGYWTKERVLDEAGKYQTRTEFQKGSAGAYQKAHKEGWLEGATAHMEELKKVYWLLDSRKDRGGSEEAPDAVAIYEGGCLRIQSC